jgi:hypothetical protein
MTQPILVFSALTSFASLMWTALAPLRELPPIPASKLPAQVKEQKAAKEAEPEFVVTRQTEVLLNGKPWRYEEIPDHASIVGMEVAADKKTVLKIHFRTRK